ncbi:hypothetical protein V6N13_128563 [Hibiscus sabdariffa]
MFRLNFDSGYNTHVAIWSVNEFLAGAGTDAPDVDENIISRPSVSYDDMWGKTLLESTEMELSLTTGEEVEIEYEVDGWFYVKKKRPGRDGKMAGLVPVLYVSQSLGSGST